MAGILAERRDQIDQPSLIEGALLRAPAIHAP
jgi:hypothetical protein